MKNICWSSSHMHANDIQPGLNTMQTGEIGHPLKTGVEPGYSCTSNVYQNSI